MFQGAKWIAANNNINTIQPAPLFRKTFILEKELKSATLYACGLGLGCYYINGRNVTDDVMLTPISKYDTRVYYNVFSVKDFLRKGKNVIGGILGNGWYFVTYPRWDRYIPQWLHHPKLLLKLELIYSDGTKDEIVSDTSWKVSDSALIYNEDKRGEIFDARLYDDMWNHVDFDDRTWKNAFICRGPGGTLYEMKFPPIRITKILKPKRISETVYDLGQNISGWARITVKGERGTEVTLRYAEVLHEDGSIAPEQLNSIIGSDTHCDKYILSGKGIESWAPRFVYHGFRYVEVTGAPDEFDIVGEVVHTDLQEIGEFSCGDDMINKIHSAVKWSTLDNMHGIPTDCPQREQNGWTGDALLSADQMFMNYDVVSFFKKWLLDIKDTQRPNGQICCIVPTSGWGYNWGSGPAWDSILIQLPYLIYYYTGDKSAIEEMWDSMVKYMEFMDSMADDYCVCFGLGDWCPPPNTDICPTIITDTAYYYTDNLIMAKCAALLNKTDDHYEKQAEAIKEKFRTRFIADDFYLGNNSTAIACAIYNHLYSEDEKKIAAQRLSSIFEKDGYHINCGILGMKYLYTALSDYGYAQTAYKITVNPQQPSYAFWILNGMTTLCETWDMKKSCNHHMYSEVDMWFYKYLAGIKILEGAEAVCIQPCFLDEIKWVKAKYKGICVYWNKNVLEVTSDKPIILKMNNRSVDLKPGTYVVNREC